MHGHTRTQGLTLIELLVGMLLVGIVMTALVSFFGQGAQLTTDSSSRSELQQEVLNGQQLLASRLREAYAVFPVGTAVSLGGGALQRTPAGTTSWTVGTDPLLAMVLPPRDPAGPCGTSAAASAGCYRFYAYYPVRRSVWLAGAVDSSGAPTASNPGADAPNDATAWAMAEYRSFYPGTTAPPAANTVTTTGASTNLLADYMAPATAAPTYTPFEYLPGGAGVAVQGVRLNFAVQRLVRGRTMRLPGATGVYSLVAYSSNLGKF